MGTLVLSDLVRDWQTLPIYDHIYVEPGPLRADSRVLSQGYVPEGVPGLRSLLSVEDFQAVFRAYSNYHNGRVPTVEQGVRAVKYFDENDAFILESP